MAEFNPKMCRVALLAGGKGSERPISLDSGKGVKVALESVGFPVIQLDPAKKSDLKRLVEENFDVAFLCTHGRYGEDGMVQGFLDLIDLPYTGSNVCASAISIDKSKTKIFYEAAGIATPPSITLKKDVEFFLPDIVKIAGEHVVVKAASEGSTLGIYMAKTDAEIVKSIEEAFEADSTVLVEKYVAGREFTVAVLGKGNTAAALPVVEIISRNELYDFDAKYSAGGSEHLCPAPIEDDLADHLQRVAEKAHRVLDCAGASRTDFLVDDNGKAWALETNTIPGMTEFSLLPDAARSAGISYEELCTRLIKIALGIYS